MPTDLTDDWRRHGAFYQVYPRSFSDSDGDGIGDLVGIRDRLPYLATLSVDGIWINPWYPSPGRDGGYDVADHRGISADLGTLDDARRLISDARAIGLGVVIDLVPNHVSSDHPWFRSALASPAGSPERARFHFANGTGPEGSSPPSDWRSHFGGSAWTPVGDGQWYLHLFDRSQPDLNWTNPDVVADFDDTIRWWRGLGVAGCRVDVAHCVSKDATYPSWPDDPGRHELPLDVVHPYKDRDELHELIRRWRSVADSTGDDPALLVAEAIVSPPERLQRFLRPGEYDQAFNFEFLESDWDATSYRRIIERSLDSASGVGRLPTWVLSNHDVPRHATRFGLPRGTDTARWLLDGDRRELDPSLGLRRARAAAMLAMSLPGAYYLYQGEELGLPEVHDLPERAITDPIWERSGHTLKGRDGCRVPLPWTSDEPGYGFTSGTSWLPQPQSWGEYAAARQSGADGSTLELYRTCLRVRAERLRHDDIEWLDLGEDVIAFDRRDLRCIVNFGPSVLPLTDGEPIVASAPLDAGGVASESAAWVAR